MAEDGIAYVIDDDRTMRESLSFLLQAAGIEAKFYSSAARFLLALPALERGCIVTDVRMPKLGGLALLNELKARGIDWPIIVITGHGDVPLAVQAMKAGAIEFFEKPLDNDVFLAALRAALQSGTRRETEDSTQSLMRQRLATLSQREHEVLQNLVSGQPNKLIAHQLGISPRTVEKYRANLMMKMQAKSLSDLVRIALRVGL